MPSNDEKPTGVPKWLTPIGIFAAVVAVVLLSNHSQEIKTPSGLPVVGDIATYDQMISQAQQLCVQPLQAYEEGKELTPDQLDNMKKAVKLIDAANEFKPATPAVVVGGSKFAPFFISGKLHAALGEYEKADQMLRQGLYNAQGAQLDQSGLVTVADAHFERSRVQFHLNNFDVAYSEAKLAVKGVPEAPDYQVALAQAALQLKKTDEAKEAVITALGLDPNNHGAQMMAKYLHVTVGKK